jgi:hypothetical protein
LLLQMGTNSQGTRFIIVSRKKTKDEGIDKQLFLCLINHHTVKACVDERIAAPLFTPVKSVGKDCTGRGSNLNSSVVHLLDWFLCRY